MSRPQARSARGSHPAEPTLALACALIALAVYLPRLCRELALLGDSATFVTAALELGVPQPSGYPLYVALGKLGSLVPIGSPPLRVHALSALAHAVTAGLIAATVQRLGGSRAAALAAALGTAFARPILLGSLYAETFPLLDLATAGLVYSALGCAAAPSGSALEKRLLVTAGLLGLAAAHHQMIALAFPGLALLASGAPWRQLDKRKVLPRAAAALILPAAALYALPLAWAGRDPAANWGDISSFGELLRLVTRSDYGGLLSPHLGSSAGSGAARQLGVFFSNLGPLAGPMLALGAVALWRRRRGATWGLVVTFALSGPLFAVANQLDVGHDFGQAYAERFVTMSLVGLAPLVGLGLTQIESWLSRALAPRPAGALVAALAALPLWVSRDISLRAADAGAHFPRELVASAPDGALVLTTGDASHGAVLYHCGLERACGSRILVAPGQLHLDWRVEQLRRRYPELVIPEPRGRFVTTYELIAANIERRGVYVMAGLLGNEPSLQRAFGYLPSGLLLRVLPSAVAPPPDFAEQAERWLEGCEGCRARPGFRTPLEQPVRLVYVQALLNHARVLASAGVGHELPSLLSARARRLDSELVDQLD